jgi:signal transduction histidine kinase
VEVTVVPFQLGGREIRLEVVRKVSGQQNVREVLRLKNEELIHFTRAVSHDLRSPLVTIQTFLKYLGQDLEKGDHVRVEADLGYIGSAAVKMEQMLEELLGLSRAGRALVEVEDVDLREVMGEALELVAGQVRLGAVEVRLPSSGFLVRGEKRRLVQLFQNLLDNAVKYKARQSEPVVEVVVELTEKGGVVTVRDNGVGIAQENQAKVFGVFERFHPEVGGSGVGLAVVKRIAETHGGRVWMESEGEGKGSSFMVELPGIRVAEGELRSS